jgi:hypothetical protein
LTSGWTHGPRLTFDPFQKPSTGRSTPAWPPNSPPHSHMAAHMASSTGRSTPKWPPTWHLVLAERPPHGPQFSTALPHPSRFSLAFPLLLAYNPPGPQPIQAVYGLGSEVRGVEGGGGIGPVGRRRARAQVVHGIDEERREYVRNRVCSSPPRATTFKQFQKEDLYQAVLSRCMSSIIKQPHV